MKKAHEAMASAEKTANNIKYIVLWSRLKSYTGLERKNKHFITILSMDFHTAFYSVAIPVSAGSPPDDAVNQ
jgi:hypothetical protein